jgi:hypothetical protein
MEVDVFFHVGNEQKAIFAFYPAVFKIADKDQTVKNSLHRFVYIIRQKVFITYRDVTGKSNAPCGNISEKLIVKRFEVTARLAD